MDHYEALGVAKNATEQQITAAFRKIATRNHPDKTAQTGEGSVDIFVAASVAYHVLSDPRQRDAYDKGYQLKESQEAAILAAAQTSLLQLLAQIVESCDENTIGQLDLRAKMLAGIAHGKADIERQQRVTRAAMRKYRRMARRLQATEFIFADWVRQRRQHEINIHRQQRVTAKVAAKMELMMAEFAYEFEPRATAINYGFSGTAAWNNQ